MGDFMDEIMENLDALTVEELEAVKAKASELIKARKEAAKEAEKAAKETQKAEHAAQASEKLNKEVKQRIVFTLKGQTREADVVKFTDKTVTVKLDEGVRYIKLANITAVIDVVEAQAAA